MGADRETDVSAVLLDVALSSQTSACFIAYCNQHQIALWWKLHLSKASRGFFPPTKFWLPLARWMTLPLPVGLPIGEGHTGVGCEAVWHVLMETQLSCLCCNTKCDVITLRASCRCYQTRGEAFCVLLILQMVKSPCYCPSLLWHSKNCHQNRFCVDMVVRSEAAGGLPQ